MHDVFGHRLAGNQTEDIERAISAVCATAAALY